MKDETTTLDSYRVKYEKLGSDELITQLWQNEELPKGSIFTVDLAELAHPISMRAGTSDMWVFDQIFLYKEMETDFGPEMAFIIDAGANIGLTSAYLANRFPNAKIVALEVDRENFELPRGVFVGIYSLRSCRARDFNDRRSRRCGLAAGIRLAASGSAQNGY